MFANLTGWHFLIILAIVLLIFGATRLPALAKSLGQSANAFKAEMRPKEGEGTTTTASVAPESDPADPIDKATKQ